MLPFLNLGALLFFSVSVNYFGFTKFLDLLQLVYPPSFVGALSRVRLFYS